MLLLGFGLEGDNGGDSLSSVGDSGRLLGSEGGSSVHNTKGYALIILCLLNAGIMGHLTSHLSVKSLKNVIITFTCLLL